MSQHTLLLLVGLVIGLTTLVVLVVQFVRSRRDSGPQRGWWEGPWDEDEKR